MWETQVWSLGREDSLEKEMAAHSSTIAWKIPWREEPGRLQSMGSLRVGHDWAIPHTHTTLLIVLFVIVVVQSLSHVRLFVTPWTAAQQTSLFFTISLSLLKLLSIESVMPSNHLILCRPLLLLPSILPSIRVFSSESALCVRWLQHQSFQWIFRVDFL